MYKYGNIIVISVVKVKYYVVIGEGDRNILRGFVGIGKVFLSSDF